MSVALQPTILKSHVKMTTVIYLFYMATITIPKTLAGRDDLVVIPKKEFDDLIARAESAVGEQDILRWSREAKQLHRAGKLPKLTTLRGI